MKGLIMRSLLILLLLVTPSFGAYGYCTMCGYSHANVPRQYLLRSPVRSTTSQRARTQPNKMLTTAQASCVPGRWVCINGKCTWVPATIKHESVDIPDSEAVITSPAASSPQKPQAEAPTPEPVIESYLDQINLIGTDVLYDFGCGDGRVVVAAARRPLKRAIGIELRPTLASRARARIRGLRRAWITTGDFHTLSVAQCTVATMYLYPKDMARLVPRLRRSPACRAIISYQHEIPLPDTRKVIIHGDPVYIWERRKVVVAPVKIHAFAWMME